jgi:deoxyxylulose-5-phosphate synthase
LETLKDAGLDDVLVHRVGMPDSFIEHGTAADQRRQLQLDAEGIVDHVLDTYFPDVAARVRGGTADQGLAATA